MSSDRLKKIAQAQAIPYENFKDRLCSFARATAVRMNNERWLNDVQPGRDFLDVDLDQYALLQHGASSFFTPFLEKRILPEGSKVVFISDIHGDAQALFSVLEHLQSVGYLDKEYHIIDPRIYIAFLGDFVNRKKNSIAVVTTVIDLFLKNEGRVFLTRGNHESAQTNKIFEYRCMNGTEHLSGAVSLLQELKESFAGYAYPDLMFWYDYLPLAVYVGIENGRAGVDFLKCCHAGFEIGYNPSAFLADTNVSFALVESIDRGGALNELRNDASLQEYIGQIDSVQQGQADYRNQFFIASFSGQVAFTNDMSLRYGSIWNKFMTEEDDSVQIALSASKRLLFLGRRFCSLLLERASSSTAKLHGVIRGHQHSDEHVPTSGLQTTMLTRIRNNKGLVRQWNGTVNTIGTASHISGYQSFTIVSFEQSPEQWSIRHCFKTEQQPFFSERIQSLFE